MATTQKTTVKRFNGVDWDNIFFATSSDIVSLGADQNIEGNSSAPFTVGGTLEASQSIQSVVKTVVDRMATLDGVVIPGLADGSSITHVNASAIQGTISRDNLPANVGGTGITVDDEDAKAALTSSDVNIGDIVKVTNGKVYLVNGMEATTPQYMELSDSASEVAWSRVTGTPTTLAGYGITDAVSSTALTDDGTQVAAVGKAVTVSDVDGTAKLKANITGDAGTVGGHDAAYFATATDMTAIKETVNGTGDGSDGLVAKVAALEAGTSITEIDAAKVVSKSGSKLSIDVIPRAALERLYITESAETLAAVTSAQVDTGDTIKVSDSGLMYFVTDASKLGTPDYMQGLEIYTAGTAASIDWANVQSKPTTLAGYGITDAVNKTNDVVEDGTVSTSIGKLVKVGADNKLKVNITGDAATLGGHAAAYFATADALTTLNDVVNAETTGLVAKVAAIETEIGDSESPADSTLWKAVKDLESGATISALAASKLTGTVSRNNLPNDISGRVIEKADLETCYTELNTSNANIGDIIKLNDQSVYIVKDTSNLASAAGYLCLVAVGAGSVHWSQITDHPTTLAGYGITDAVSSTEVVTEALTEAAGKLVKVASDGKMHVNITGDAATLGGHGASYFATAAALAEVSARAPMVVNSASEIESPVEGQLAIIINA